MNRITDVLIIGSGMAGLVAALAATKNNCKTSILCEGMGNLSISGGTIDLLGYDIHGNFLIDPWQGISQLPSEHPYSLLGTDNIKEALDEVLLCLKENGLDYKTSLDEKGSPVNTKVPTIFGTLKPAWLFTGDYDSQLLQKASKILVIGIKGFRDCKPRLIINQLKRYPDWKDKEFEILILPPPFSEKGRSLNALDIAHAVDREKGKNWLFVNLREKGKGYDLALLPPILGSRAESEAREKIASKLGCPVVEMQCIPPGVGGLRIRDALIKCLEKKNVDFFENAKVIGSSIKDGICENITVFASGREVQHKAKAYVIATGGILGGGILLGEGTAREAITGMPLKVPSNVDEWTEPEIFGQHLITKFGIKTDNNLRLAHGEEQGEITNVFFAGRTIGGYDYASEKSGHGVALATGWKAGVMAAAQAGSDPEKNQIKGE